MRNARNLVSTPEDMLQRMLRDFQLERDALKYPRLLRCATDCSFDVPRMLFMPDGMEIGKHERDKGISAKPLLLRQEGGLIYPVFSQGRIERAMRRKSIPYGFHVRMPFDMIAEECLAQGRATLVIDPFDNPLPVPGDVLALLPKIKKLQYSDEDGE